MNEKIKCAVCGAEISAARNMLELAGLKYIAFRGHCESCDVFTVIEKWVDEDD